MGIDEIALKKGHKDYVLVISDLKNKRILAILPDRLKETLVEWLSSLQDEMKKSLRTICLDMWEPYHLAVKEVLPDIDIVVDRFHISSSNHCRSSFLRFKTGLSRFATTSRSG